MTESASIPHRYHRYCKADPSRLWTRRQCARRGDLGGGAWAPRSRNPTRVTTASRQGRKGAHPSAATTGSSRRITRLTSSTRDPRMRRPVATVSPVPASAADCDLRTVRSRYAARSSAHSHVLSPPSYAPGTRSAGASTNAAVRSSSGRSRERSWKRASKRSRRASTWPFDPGSVRGEYESASGSAESCAADRRIRGEGRR